MASFRKRNNLWEYRIRYKDIKTGKYKEKSKANFVRKSDAIEAANKVELKISQGIVETDGNPLFIDYLIQTNDLNSVNLSANTKLGRQVSIKRLTETFKNIRIKDISQFLVQDYLNKLASINHLKRATLSRDFQMIKMTMKRARSEQYVLNDVLSDVFIPKTNSSKKQPYWTLNDFKRYLEIQNDVIARDLDHERWLHYRLARRNLAVIATLVGSGARVGELCALNVEDFDAANGQLILHHNLHYEESKKDTGPKLIWVRSENMKTNNSFREVPLPDKTIEILKSWIEFRPEFLKMSHKKDDGSLFPSHKFEYRLRPHNVKLLCTQINNDYGLQNIHPHSFRHTYASLLSSANVPAKQAQILLGHSEIETTLNIYTHVSADDKEIAINKLNNLMNPKKIE